METLRDFLDRREGEIKSQIKALKAELTELKTARGAVASSEGVTNGSKSSDSSAPTIKDMSLSILRNAHPDGITAQEILSRMSEQYNREIDRASLSPQLSRLRKEGSINLDDGRWSLRKDEAENSAPQMDELLGPSPDDGWSSSQTYDDYGDPPF